MHGASVENDISFGERRLRCGGLSRARSSDNERNRSLIRFADPVEKRAIRQQMRGFRDRGPIEGARCLGCAVFREKLSGFVGAEVVPEPLAVLPDELLNPGDRPRVDLSFDRLFSRCQPAFQRYFDAGDGLFQSSVCQRVISPTERSATNQSG